jgi:hypothetical protein
MVESSEKPGAQLLCKTSCNDDSETWSAFLEASKASKKGKGLLFGFLPNTAGIQEDHISLRYVGGDTIPT